MFKLPVLGGSLDRDWSVALVRPRPSRAFTQGIAEREVAFTVMYCMAQCAGAWEGGRSGLKERGSLCEEEERAKEREGSNNECVKISLAHPEKSSSMCY